MARKFERSLGGPPAAREPISLVRKTPMKVLCLGYSRTGTSSIREALLILGYHHTYHTVDALSVNPFDCKLWLDAIKAKHEGVGKTPGCEDFDQLLGHCQAVADMPAAYFAPELIKAYPDAKVILTVRDIDRWHKSVENSLQAANRSLVEATLAFTAKVLLMPDRWNFPMLQKLEQVLYGCDFQRNGRKSLQQHYNLVRSIVPPERLLEYHVSQGWEPLCSFLDKPIPSQEIPFINDSTGFKQAVRERHLAKVRAQLKRVLDISAYTALAAILAMSAVMITWLPISK